MPSFFRSDDDVRLFFLRELDTPDKKKKYARLKTIFTQCVRRPGTRGNFFFHRKSSSLGGAPILIFEPQGPVDRGIFQGGITHFGETLFGTFQCTAPGFIELEVKKNLSPANALKYSRAIRNVIKNIAGIMQSGSDDRVQIITPRQKALAAREAAAQKRKEADEARERRRQKNEERRQAREARRRKKDEARRAASQQSARQNDAARQEDATSEAAAPSPPSPKQQRRQAREQESTARIERLQKEAEAAEAEGLMVEASAAAEDARDIADELAASLSSARAPVLDVAAACEGKNPVQAQATLFQLIAAGTHKAAATRLLARMRAASPDQQGSVIADWLDEEEAYLSELADSAQQAESEALSLEKLSSRSEGAALSAREASARLHVAELQARLRRVELSEHGSEADVAALQESLQEAESVRLELQMVGCQQDAIRALRAIRSGLDALEAARSPILESPKQLRRGMRQDPSMRKGLKRLRRAIEGLRQLQAPNSMMLAVWDEYPDLLWAQATILSAM